MKFLNMICASTLAATLIGGASGCATSSQREDAKINSQVQTLLDERTNLEATNGIEVQTLNSTVYLRGLVSTDLDRQAATEIAYEVPGVGNVVNSIGLEN